MGEFIGLTGAWESIDDLDIVGICPGPGLVGGREKWTINSRICRREEGTSTLREDFDIGGHRDSSLPHVIFTVRTMNIRAPQSIVQSAPYFRVLAPLGRCGLESSSFS